MEPCRQEGAIGSLEATADAIKETLERLEKGQDRFIQILESIAQQGAKITRLEADVEHLYERVRVVECSAATQGTKIAGASAFLGMVVAATVAYLFKKIGG